jgi:capsular exopolysaccharide synthesis family protein
MTFKQIVDVLWQRKVFIIVVTAVAMVVAVVYLQLQVKSYASTASARASVSVTEASLGGELGGVQVDFDPSTITSPKVLDQAAVLAGEPGAALAGSVSYEVEEGARTNVYHITVAAASPELAQRRAAAVVEAYRAHLQDQVDQTLDTLTTRQEAAVARARDNQRQAALAPDSSIAASNLASALSTLGSLNNQIDAIKTSGSPLILLVAAPPGKFLGSSTLIVLAVALATGLIAGIGIALIRDQFDNRLRGEHEIHTLTSLPSLGELSLDRSLARRDVNLPAASRDQTALSEGLRSLRTSMQVLLPRENAVVVFTSVEPGDGKTFVSANVALTWARAGKKVILVGGDLRRPSLGAYFGNAAEGPGLAELLVDGATKGLPLGREQIIAKLNDSEYPRLQVLPAGLDPVDPADLLATSSLKQVIDVVRRLADVVIIDSPPAMTLVDASLLGEHADGVILLASVNRTDRSYLAETVDSLRQHGVPMLGVVANRSRRALPKSYAPYYVRNDEQTSSADDRQEAGTVDHPKDATPSVENSPGR